MMDIKQIALSTALKKLFTERSFSICAIDDCVKMMNVIPDREVYEIMRTVHCVNYSDMPLELRKWLIDSTYSMFSINGCEFVDVEDPSDKKQSKRGIFNRLKPNH